MQRFAKKLNKNIILAALATTALVACTADIDYYDPDFMQQQAQEAFPVPFETVDTQHTWETVTLRTATVAVSLNLSSVYQIGLYTNDPLHEGTGARLLATGVVADGGFANFTFDCPAALGTIYVSVTDEQKHAIAYQAAFDENGHADANVAFAASRANDASTRALESEAPDYAATCQDYLGSLTDEAMRYYVAFTDEDIDRNNTFTNGTYDWSTNPPTVSYTIGDGHHLRVAQGTTITKTFHLNGPWDTADDVVVYVEGTMHLNGNTLNSATIVVAPTGHVIVDGTTKFTNMGRFIVEAGGQITGADDVTLEVSNSQRCYNAGTISFAGKLNVNGTDFYNCGTVSVNSLEDTSSSGKITNFGRIVVGNNQSAANAYNCNFVNACYMSYSGDAGVGNLRQLNGAYLHVGGKLELTGTANLGSLSLIDTNDLLVSNTAFAGPTADGEYAVLKIGGNLYAGWGDAWSFSGTSVVDWKANGVYVNGTWSEDDGAWSVLTGLKGHVTYWASEHTTAVSIPASTCNTSGEGGDSDTPGGFEPDEEVELPTETQAYTYMFEDMTAVPGDYDFNDCVISVTTPIDGTLTLTVWAAGGRKAIDLCLRPNPLYNDTYRVLLSDVTKQFRTAAGRQSDGWIINTEPDEDVFEPIVITVRDLPSNFTLAANGDFFIADSYGQVHIPVFTQGFRAGDIPYALRVPGTWRWPVEFMPVTSAYSGFARWAQDATQDIEWYASGYVDANVYQHLP